jgi:hypothetical protein
LFSELIHELHLSPLEVLVLEVHVVLFLDDFRHLAELVHVELSDEGGEVLVAEKMRQDLLFQFLTTFDEHLIVAIPAEIILILLFLK